MAKKCELCGKDKPLRGKTVKNGERLTEIKMLCDQCRKGR